MAAAGEKLGSMGAAGELLDSNLAWEEETYKKKQILLITKHYNLRNDFHWFSLHILLALNFARFNNMCECMHLNLCTACFFEAKFKLSFPENEALFNWNLCQYVTNHDTNLPNKSSGTELQDEAEQLAGRYHSARDLCRELKREMQQV